MAVNPTTIKLAVKVAISVLTDEDTRNKVIVVAVAPIAALVLLVSLILYILTMPFTLLQNFFIGDRYNNAQEFRVSNGYEQKVDPTNEDTIQDTGLDFTQLTFIDGQTNVHYYSQLDGRWKDLPYGHTSTIGQAGCGPTSLAIAVSSLTNTQIDPIQMSQWAYENGYLCEGSGSYHSLIPEGGRHFGLTVEGCTANEPQKIIDALSSGKLVIVILGKGHFTKSGHFLVMRGVTAEGKILIADPASTRKSNIEWDLSIFLDEARKGAAAGGPFWILSTPHI